MDEEEKIKKLREKFTPLLPLLNERDRRLTLAAEAKSLGFGGITLVHLATGVARSTINTGIHELTGKLSLTGNIRRPGAGKRKKEETDKTILEDLKKLVGPTARGDPETPLQYTTKSRRHLAKALREMGHKVSHGSIGRLLKLINFSLQSMRKRFEGKQHPDRDAQFLYIAKNAKEVAEKDIPLISVDTKKKELIGPFKNNPLREVQPVGHPVETNAYDFPSYASGIARPYGVYDIQRNEGYVSIGVSSDTAEFSVASIQDWWEHYGINQYANAPEIDITADSGGSNGNRLRLWKWKLQQLANTIHKTIRVFHYPAGTSKWNKIEHRLFSQISRSFRGKVFDCYDLLLNLVWHVKTETGLIVHARIDWNVYKTGIEVTKKEWESINVKWDKFHREWNYAIYPNV